MLFRSATLLTAALSLLSTATAKSAVLDLIPTNFDETVLKSGKPALVEFFAPWCGHCKTLAPIYEELGLAFEHVKDKVSIAKVDADANRDLGSRFGVQGFPTLKWFDGKSEKPIDYSSGRDLESLSAFITEKTGLKAKGKKATPSDVEFLTDASFANTVGKDKDVLVAFTAPWCGHCKTLAPVWESLATTFSGDKSSVIIAKVDAEAPNAKRTAQDQGVKSYPTIKFFPRGSATPEDYAGARSESDFVTYINEKAGTHRVPGGGLDATAGTIAALDTLVAKFTSKQNTLAEVGEELKKAAEGVTDTYAAYYLKVVEKLTKSEGYVEKEGKRLAGLLKKGGLAPGKADDLAKRSNILARFKESVKETVQSVKEEL
ncbi:putative disulfide isomerase [Myriangium duriaei CBS 260.36]|uniref:protein disulfide-isomerase n=1 Tax=Myriangium duriaei CBS 260.36 TaxID=1168546 RepID=A0A9P4JAX8_9PEZI|nr:putative disulfide isomerase [Myriangium duriaei CBS 260.36]